MRVHVYWNLNRRCWSVRAAQGERCGRVVAYLDRVTLTDCRMVIQQAGLRKTRSSGVKNVHAYIKGLWVEPEPIEGALVAITYNPWLEGRFVRRDTRQIVHQARVCQFTIKRDGGPWCAASL